MIEAKTRNCSYVKIFHQKTKKMPQKKLKKNRKTQISPKSKSTKKVFVFPPCFVGRTPQQYPNPYGVLPPDSVPCPPVVELGYNMVFLEPSDPKITKIIFVIFLYTPTGKNAQNWTSICNFLQLLHVPCFFWIYGDKAWPRKQLISSNIFALKSCRPGPKNGQK